MDDELAYAEGRRDQTDEFAELLPGPYYMDPPDGGSVTVLEQFRRMAEDAARYRHMRDSATFRCRNGPGLYWYLPRHMKGDSAERLDEAIDEARRAKP